MRKFENLRLMTIIVMVMALFFTSTAGASAAVVKLNKTKLTLDPGKTATLKLVNTKQQIAWSSAKKSVATVSSKGKVTAKKPGTTTITAKVKGKKYTCKVTVRNYPLGSFENPAIASKGVTLEEPLQTDNSGGKYAFQVTNVYRGENALNKIKNDNLMQWYDFNQTDYEKYTAAGKVLVLMEAKAEYLTPAGKKVLGGIVGIASHLDTKTAKVLKGNTPLILNMSNISYGEEKIFYYAAYFPKNLTSYVDRYHPANGKTKYGTYSYYVRFDLQETAGENA